MRSNGLLTAYGLSESDFSPKNLEPTRDSCQCTRWNLGAKGTGRRLFEMAGLKFPVDATVAIHANDGGIRWPATRWLHFRRPIGLPCPWRNLVYSTVPAREVSVIRKRSSHEYVDRPLLDIRAAASHLGCSERFIRRLVQERRIPFVKLGGTRVRFLELDLDQWVVGQRVEAKR